jgi:hypothetical protein
MKSMSAMGGKQTLARYGAAMVKAAEPPRFEVEAMGESGGHCECCGNESSCVWGMVHDGGATVAGYWMHWTVGHLSDPGANLDLILGQWGDKTSAEDRVLVSLLHRQQPDGSPALMVIDAAERPRAKGDLARTALARTDVVGSPLAAQVFALVDAIYEQDGRFF